MPSPLLAGIKISPRFAEALGMAEEKQSRQQMTHTRSSTQDDKSFEQNLYEKSDIYKSLKNAYTAPMRAIEGTLDPYSPEGVAEAVNLAGTAMVGSMPGGASGPGSVGMMSKLGKEKGFNIEAAHGTLSPQGFLKRGEGETLFSRSAANEVKGDGGYAVLGEGFYFSPRVSRGADSPDWHNYYTEGYKGEIPEGATVIPTELKLKKPLFYSSEWAGSRPPMGKSQAAKTQKELADFIRKSKNPEYEQFLINTPPKAMLEQAFKFKLLRKYPEFDKIDSPMLKQMDRLERRGSLTERLKDRYPEEYAAAKAEAEELDSFRILGSASNPRVFSKMLKEAGFDGVIDVPDAQYMVLDPENIRSPFEEVSTPTVEEPLAPVVEEPKEDKFLEMSTQIKELEAKIESLKEVKKEEVVQEKPQAIDPLQLSIEKLSSMIENMGKPKTIIRDKDGKITGVA